jgi:hypothetical protein
MLGYLTTLVKYKYIEHNGLGKSMKFKPGDVVRICDVTLTTVGGLPANTSNRFAGIHLRGEPAIAFVDTKGLVKEMYERKLIGMDVYRVVTYDGDVHLFYERELILEAA